LLTRIEKIQKKDCVIEIYGLGYVGFPLSIRLAMSGYKVVGIDKDNTKINRLKNLELSETEEDFKKELQHLIESNSISFTDNPIKTESLKIGIICVPTPIPNTTTNSDVYVNEAVNNFLINSKKEDIIILESSIEVGTTEKIKNIIETKGFTVGNDFGLAFCPERIDPQNKKWNLENIPRIIYCSDDQTYNICQELYKGINNSNLRRVTKPKTAEVVKSFENAFRLVNISLVNELAILCDKFDINVKEVIDAAATKPFGFMPFYPSAGAGGHCIPKDPRFLLESAKKFGIEFKTLQESLDINKEIPKYIAKNIEKILLENKLKKSVLVCGLSYKPDIEDMRDSPGFKIITELKKLRIDTAGIDPFYKKELENKYKIENYLDENSEINMIKDFDDNIIRDFGCICIVQLHTKTKFDLIQLYKKSKVPFIYDCQSKLNYDPESKTILKKFGD
jgi:UDP-N-acetyl-D-glucosamine dehydrogenase